MNAYEQFCYCTTRIESVNTNASTISVGTGFFFTFTTKNGNHKVLLITNKHVIEGSNKLTIHFSAAKEDGFPNINSHINLVLSREFDQIIYKHPDLEIDLCALDITNYILNMINNGQRIFFRSFELKDIPTKEQILDIDPIVEVEMVGYPSSLWDESHNMPLFRRCLTASRIDIDWQNKKIFLLDGACVEGSSGSPIILYVSHYYSRINNTTNLGQPRMFLLGIQFARHNRSVEGVLKMGNGLVVSNLKPIVDIPNNIGYAIKSDCIKDVICLVEKNELEKGTFVSNIK